MYDGIDPRNLPDGTVVDGYTISGKLGGGGMGEIYRVRRGREVFALKLQGERLTEAMDPVKREELDARSRREAAVLLSLSHPNILSIIGSGRWPDRGGYLYLITELVDGEPLDGWHQRKQPSLRQLATVFERVADAVDYMHRAGIYHRDLKEPNVLVRADGSPVVIDLGIARSPAAYTLTRVGTVIGTTTHLSPGVCRYLVGEKSHAYRFGVHDDLHALGFMLYERLTGTAPFRQRTDVEWPEFDYYRQVMEHVPPAPRALCPPVPVALSDIAMRLLAKTPEKGYPGAEAVRQDLEKALAEAPDSWNAPYPVPRGVQRRDLTRNGVVRLPQPDDVEAERKHPRDGSDVSPGRPPAAGPVVRAAGAGAASAVSAAPAGSTQAAIDALAAGEATSTAAPGFRPPTATEAAPFVPPATAPQPGKPPEQGKLLGESGLRRLGEQLRHGAPPRRRLGPLGLTFLGAALLVGGAFAARYFAGHRRAPEKSVLVRYQEELAAEQRAGQPGTAGEEATVAPPSGAAAVPREDVGPSTTAREVQSPPPALHSPGGRGSAPSASDAKAIQAELERAYGKKRPTLSGKSPSMPSWVKGVEVVDAKPLATGERKLGGRYGDHLRLQLRSNLDSRLCGSGAVEAVLVRPYLVSGEVVLPARTLAYGQCAVQAGRFLIAFSRLRLPDGAEVKFDGLAMDVTDGKPGLLATRHVGGERGSAPESLGGTIARGTASTVLGAATGGAGLAGQVANGAGQSALNARPAESSAAGEEVLLLDAGAGVDVFVRQAF